MLKLRKDGVDYIEVKVKHTDDFGISYCQSSCGRWFAARDADDWYTIEIYYRLTIDGTTIEYWDTYPELVGRIASLRAGKFEVEICEHPSLDVRA